jgi:hypothetical protein
MRFVMLICNDEAVWAGLSKERADAVMSEIMAWVDKERAAGRLVPGGQELDSARTARTVSRGPDGRPVVVDGPYLELKEVVGGFFLIEAADFDEAVDIASGWPGIAANGDKVEIRPIMVRE